MKKFHLTFTSLTIILKPLLLLAIVLISISTVKPASAACGTTNVALNKPATASSVENGGTTANLAVDGNTGTRWSSAFSDPQWLQVDLGATTSICGVTIIWETAYATAFQIQVSNDAATWTTIYSTTTGTGGTQNLTGLSGSGRYIRMYGTVRATGYGYSIWEFQVFSGSGGPPTNTPIPSPTATSSPVPTSAGCGTTNVALNKTATASSVENAGTTANLAVDGNTGTRWSSAFSDPQWLQVDLGATTSICGVTIIWETAYATAFQLQVSNDAATWTTIYSTTTGTGGTQNLTGLSGSGRYIRMYGTARATGYGYSIWEFQVFAGSGGATSIPTNTSVPPTATRTNTPTNTPAGPPTNTPIPSPTSSGGCGTGNVALNKTATASSVENAGTTANLAVDGNLNTRWSSAYSDPQWLQVDLGATYSICHVTLVWEAAYATAFQIQVSNDAANWTTIYSTTTGTGGTNDLTGLSGSGRYIRMYGTARATGYGYSLWEFQVFAVGVTFTPTPLPTPTATMDASFWGDTSTIPAAKNVMMFEFLNKTNGKYPDSQVYWSFNGTTQSIANQKYFDMPANSSGRMYFYLGAPNSQYADFIEFTIGPAQFNGNTTRVDGFGLKLAMRLHTKDGIDQAVGEDLTTFQEDRSVTFQKFINEVPTEFQHLAQIQAPYFIPAPAHGSDTAFLPGGAYAHYFDAYIASVGSTATTADVFGCTNTLGANAALCAGINRHVAQLSAAQQADPSQFYLTAPANYYAQFWHHHSISALAYGFPYDDVNGQAAYMSYNNPQWMIIAIGW